MSTAHTMNIAHADAAHLQCYIVKLTDSSLNIIQQFSKLKSKGGSISLNGKEGSIKLEAPNKFASFDFQVAACTESGRYAVVQETGPRALKQLGQITGKLTVKATDDTYDSVRGKMAKLDDDQKKNMAKELVNNTSVRKRLNPSKQQTRPAVSIPAPKRPHIETPSSSTPGAPVTNQKTKLLHMLALRPCTKLELQRSLGQLGPAVLTDVAAINTKGEYTLKDRFYLQIKPDEYPLYSQKDKQDVLKKIARVRIMLAPQKVAEAPKPQAQPHRPPVPRDLLAYKFKPLSDDDETDRSASSSSTPTDENRDSLAEASKLSTVRSEAERDRLANLYDSHYKNYKSLYSKLRSKVSYFLGVKPQVQEFEQNGGDSPDYQSLKAEILSEYGKLKRDKDYVATRERYQTRHDQLARIKELVLRYDESVMASS